MNHLCIAIVTTFPSMLLFCLLCVVSSYPQATKRLSSPLVDSRMCLYAKEEHLDIPVSFHLGQCGNETPDATVTLSCATFWALQT